MTITVTNIVAGPFTATGAEQEVAFDFKVFTREEVEVVYGSERTAIDPDTYVVEPNRTIDGQVLEGGTITLLAGALPAGTMFNAVAKPAKTQELVFSDTGSRLRNLNEVADRAALRAIRAQYDGALEGAGSELIELATEAGAAAGAEAAINKADRDLENAIRLRSATGAVAASVNAVLDRMPPMPAEFDLTVDADLTAPVDQTAELQAMLNAAPKGGEGVGINGTYYINTELALDEGRSLYSRTSTGEIYGQVGYGTRKGTLVLGPNGIIKLTNGSGLYGLNIIRLDAVTPPDTTDPYGTYMRIQAWENGAIYAQELIGSDSVVEDCTIIGFGVAAIYRYVERIRFVNNKVDCSGGIVASKVYDTSRVRDNHVWPFWTARLFDIAGTGVTPNVSAPGSSRSAYDNQPPGFYFKDTSENALYWRVGSPGVWKSALDIQTRQFAGFAYGDSEGGGVDGILSSGNLVFGHPVGFDVIAEGTLGGNPARSYACSFSDNWIDRGSGTNPVAFRFTGNVHEAVVTNNHVDSHNTAIELNQSGSVHIRDLTIGGVSYTAVRIMNQSASGIIDGITQSGTTGHLVKVEASAGDLTIGGQICGFAISNLWPTGAVSSMINCGNILARRALKIDHKTISRYRGAYVPKNFEGYGQTNLGAEQAIPGTGVSTIIGLSNAVANGLGEWGVDFAHYPWENDSIYDYTLIVAFKPDNAGPGQFGVDIIRNGTKVFRGLQTTITDAELKVFTIPFRLGSGAGQKIQFAIDSQVPGVLATDFNNTRVTFNRAL